MYGDVGCICMWQSVLAGMARIHIFIILNRAYLTFSKHAGDPMFSALVDLVVSYCSEISKFEACLA